MNMRKKLQEVILINLLNLQEREKEGYLSKSMGKTVKGEWFKHLPPQKNLEVKKIVEHVLAASILEDYFYERYSRTQANLPQARQSLSISVSNEAVHDLIESLPRILSTSYIFVVMVSSV